MAALGNITLSTRLAEQCLLFTISAWRKGWSVVARPNTGACPEVPPEQTELWKQKRQSSFDPVRSWEKWPPRC